ncbi:MAG: FtsW/RodA/SpoVE family cell cycle protein [Armatimonadota bacterium]
MGDWGLFRGAEAWLERVMPPDTKALQIGLWLLIGLCIFYLGWSWFRRRRRGGAMAGELRALPGGSLPAGEKFPFNGHDVLIGRGEDAAVRLSGHSIARRHAVISAAEGRYWVDDLHTATGVRVNGRQISGRSSLRDGDLLEIGAQCFRFHQRTQSTWRPHVWVALLLALSSALFIFAQWAAWGATNATVRPPAEVVHFWTLALVAGSWAATGLIRLRRGVFDPILVPVALALTGIGLTVVLRAQPELYTRQALACALGLGALTLMALLPLHRIGRYRYLCLVGGLALLIATLFVGHTVGDQRLAVSTFGFQFQPAEPAKLLLAVFLAGLLSERQELVARSGRSWALTRSDVRYMGPMVVAWGVALALLIVQRDLGTALLFFGLFVAFVGMASGRFIFVIMSLGAFAFGAVLSAAAFDRVRERVTLWLDPWQDPQGLGYQISQGLFALGAGGLQGLGLGHGFPHLVPAAHTDLPIVVIGEELGLIGTLAVLSLIGLVIARGYRAAARADDDFLGLLSAGLSTVLALQTLVIVGGVVRLLPLTGVTLPFISFGGSSLVTNLALIGMLVGISASPAAPRVRSAARVPSYSWKRQVRWVIATAFAGILALGGMLAYWQVNESKVLAADQHNPRLRLVANEIERGKILSIHGETLAETIRKDGKYVRRLPHSSLVSQILGYSTLRHGKTGVEGEADAALIGIERADSLSEALKREEAGIPGDNVRLTINLPLQKYAAELLGSRRGSIVALDPRTGAVRAMVSNPRYSLHRAEERWEELTTHPGKPLLFRATQGVYPPGSTFKVVTAAIALDSGEVKPDETFYCPGAASIGSYTWRCFGGKAHGRLNLHDALRVSCNVTFGKIGYRLGRERLVEGAKKFGIGVAPPMSTPTSAGLLAPDPRPWRSIPVQLGFGQGPLAVTPLQMALVAAAIGNDGVVMKPYTIRDYETPEGVPYHQTKPEPWQRAVDEKAARAVRQMMASVVERGTGGRARMEQIQIGGKTGTAENPHGEDHAWFISLAPVKDPKLAVAVIVEGAGQGGKVAAPIAQKLIAKHFGLPTGDEKKP